MDCSGVEVQAWSLALSIVQFDDILSVLGIPLVKARGVDVVRRLVLFLSGQGFISGSRPLICSDRSPDALLGLKGADSPLHPEIEVRGGKRMAPKKQILCAGKSLFKPRWATLIVGDENVDDDILQDDVD